MNFMGMGMVEIGVILLIGFLALGPNKSIEMARTTGKLVGDLRRTFNEILSAANLEGGDKPTYRRPNSGPSDPAGDPPTEGKQ